MLREQLNQQLHEAEAAQLRRRRRTVQSPCAPQQVVDGRVVLAFCSNDYLGLANHPEVVTAMQAAVQKWGVGSGASHLVSGHTQAHSDLENLLAQWQSPSIPQAQGLAFCTGFMANVALMAALGDSTTTTIFADKWNHASLVDGALLAKARLQRYPHGNLAHLQRLLEASDAKVKLIVTDGVFSMDGDIADIPALLALAEQHQAWLVVDDAHGLGVLGTHGQGCLAHYHVHSDRLIWMGTLGKAVGVSGAVVVAHADIIAGLVQKARPYIYSTATPAALAETACASLRWIASAQGDVQRAHLQALIAQLRTGLAPLVARHAGWSLPASHTAIQPLIVGSNAHALALSAALEQKGIWVPAIRPPTVPEGTARLRITLSAAHTTEQVQRLLQALAAAAQEVGV